MAVGCLSPAASKALPHPVDLVSLWHLSKTAGAFLIAARENRISHPFTLRDKCESDIIIDKQHGTIPQHAFRSAVPNLTAGEGKACSPIF